jgi:uncharacterized cupin superfamily protein
MPNIHDTDLELRHDGLLRARLGAAAGAERLGLTLYEVPPGLAMHFHFHANREELLIVLDGTLTLRTNAGSEEVAPGSVVAFPTGEHGSHGYENNTDTPVRLLMISEQTLPNVTVYPDTNEIGIFDADRLAALFDLGDARWSA